jgi:raffinose/stachyose/melibiose transport system permease protein
MRRNSKGHMVGEFLLFAGPAVFAFIAVVIIPFLYGIYLTFTSWDGLSPNKPFVGFQNYAEVFKDSSFWGSLGQTILYVLISTVLVNLVGFGLALLVTGKIKGKNFFRAGFFTPNLIGGIILGYIWQFVFNRVLTSMDFMKKSMLSSGTSAFVALIIVTIWQYSGYMMLIYIAGLTGVSEDLREAAKIDGCTERQATRYIVLPLMRSSFTICLFLTITRCFMVYDVNLSLTEGGPGGSTTLAAMYVYNKAFSSKQYGPGQTEAIILFLVAAIIAVTQAKINSKKEVEA